MVDSRKVTINPTGTVVIEGYDEDGVVLIAEALQDRQPNQEDEQNPDNIIMLSPLKKGGRNRSWTDPENQLLAWCAWEEKLSIPKVQERLLRKFPKRPRTLGAIAQQKTRLKDLSNRGLFILQKDRFREV